MNCVLKPFKNLLVTATLVLCFLTAVSQPAQPVQTKQFREFTHLLNQANVSFKFPAGFKEIRAVNDEDFSYDYAVRLPDREFEIWFQVRSQKENFESYQKSNKQLANPDSLYIEAGRAQAEAFTGGQDFTAKNLTDEILSRYNADAGKFYLLDLLDLPVTNHYKYALLVTLQKNHTGSIIAVCFTNVKDAEFFKKMRQVADCIKFKPTKP